jgi:hypothetical protein
MATYYWVGGTGTWNTSSTTNWASSSNGSGGAGVPTSVDDVIIDGSSGTGTITCTGAVCNDITVTASQAIILGAASSTLSVFGNLTFPSGGSFSSNSSVWSLTFASTTTGKTITLNGKSLWSVIFNGVGGAWTLGSAFQTSSTINLTNGTLDTSSSGNYSITISGSAVITYGAGTKTLNLNASTVSVSGFGSSSNITGFTLNAGTSTINISNPLPSLFGNGLTFYDVSITGTASNSITINGQVTFNNLTITSRTSDGILPINITANQTINGTLTLGASNTAVRRLFLASDTIGTTRTITATTVATLSDVDFRDISFSASQSGTRLGDCGGNTNITFPAAKTVYWNLTGTQNWSAVAWATTNNGTPNVNNFPLAQDTATFTNSGTAATVSTSANWNIGTIDMSTRTTAFTFNLNSNTAHYGSLTLFSGLTLGTGGTTTFVGRGTQTITSAGKTFGNAIVVNCITGTFQLADSFTSTNTLTHTSGTFNGNTYNVTCTTFNSNNSNTRTLTLGDGLWTLTSFGTVWSTGTTTGLTFNKGTSDILLSDTSTAARSFTTGALTYNKITIGGLTGISTTTITNSGAVFNELASIKTVAHTISFTANQTITTWSVKGTAGNVVTVNSTAAGTQRIITVTNKTDGIDYLNVQDISNSNIAPITFYAGANSTNSGNNNGIAFIASSTASPQTAYLLTSGTTFTVPSDWNSSNNNIYMIGAAGGGGSAAVSGNNRAAGGGGGGGAFTQLTNFTATPSSSVTYAIGTSAANTNGGNTTWDSGTYIANGGLRGTAATTPTSAGGAGGAAQTVSGIITAAFAGGNGGAGSFGTTVAQAYASGGGGGAGGPNGVGGNGGTGFGSTTAANIAGGGGGGNGGGSNGGNAASATFGAGGNNFGGTGGGATAGANGTLGGGGAGRVNVGLGGSGGSGIDILNTLGGGGGRGGAATGQAASDNTGLYGGGGNGGTVSTGGTIALSGAGSQGVIFIVYTPISLSNAGFGFRLSNTGILYVPTTSEFDEVTQSTISVKPTAFYAEEFDEVTNPGVPARYLNNGIVQTQSIIDEITGIS